MIIGAHQPNFMPHMGFFDKMSKCDVFVIRDDVAFTKGDFHHRNKIRCNSSDNLNNPMFKWITLHVLNKGNLVDTEINPARNQEIIRLIERCYSHANYFHYWDEIRSILDSDESSMLNLNMKIIDWGMSVLNISCKIVFASSLSFERRGKSEDLSSICDLLNGSVYLSGDGGKSYMNDDVFNVDVIYQNYKPIRYKQHLKGWIPYMSFIDWVFCNGNKKIND